MLMNLPQNFKAPNNFGANRYVMMWNLLKEFVDMEAIRKDSSFNLSTISQNLISKSFLHTEFLTLTLNFRSSSNKFPPNKTGIY